jgi:tight adherence protein C
MTPELLLAIIGVFVAVAAFAGTATSWALERNLPEKRRLQSLGDAQRSGIVMDGSRLTAELPDPTLARLSRLLPRSAKDMSRLQRQLTRAGYPSFSAVIWYSVAEILLPAIMFLAVVTVLGVRSGLLPAAFLAILGYIAPSFYIGHRVKQRQKAIRNGLPDALDLLTVCVEAGSALDQAIARTTEDLHIPHPELADELRKITTEVRAGIPRSQALKNFATRTGVDDVRTLVSMLSQTDRFGTSVGEALRVHADTSRTKRRQFAEERAGKVGVKLVFPLALCLFPALYVVCFGPVVVQIYRTFIVGQP